MFIIDIYIYIYIFYAVVSMFYVVCVLLMRLHRVYKLNKIPRRGWMGLTVYSIYSILLPDLCFAHAAPSNK